MQHKNKVFARLGGVSEYEGFTQMMISLKMIRIGLVEYPTRISRFLIGSVELVWGIMIGLLPDILERPIYHNMTALMGATEWAISFFLAGFITLMYVIFPYNTMYGHPKFKSLVFFGSNIANTFLLMWSSIAMAFALVPTAASPIAHYALSLLSVWVTARHSKVFKKRSGELW